MFQDFVGGGRITDICLGNETGITKFPKNLDHKKKIQKYRRVNGRPFYVPKYSQRGKRRSKRKDKRGRNNKSCLKKGPSLKRKKALYPGPKKKTNAGKKKNLHIYTLPKGLSK